MNCYLHPTSGVVATCNRCGRGLCADCSSVYNLPLCGGCAQSVAGSERSTIVRSFAWSVALTILALVLTAGGPGGNTLLVAYLMAGIPWGWRVLSRITPNVFLFMPVGGWLLYVGVKLGLSIWVGVVALPYFVVTRAKRWRELKALTPASA